MYCRNALGKESCTKASPKFGKKPDARILQNSILPAEVRGSKVISFCVGSAASRSKSKIIDCHVWGESPKGSFLRLNEEFCVSTPEACFLQMSTALPLEHLIELGYLLCGTYVPSHCGYVPARGLEPLTSVDRLHRYLLRAVGIKGRKRALRALRYVGDGAASVMESKLAMLLCLPCSMGGEGFPLPLLNAQIKLPRKICGRTATGIRRPDFLWMPQSVALEYDSSTYHSSREEVQADVRRQNELTACGIRCLVARWGDVSDRASFARLCHELEALLGVRRRTKIDDHDQRKEQLRAMLFGAGGWSFLREER